MISFKHYLLSPTLVIFFALTSCTSSETVIPANTSPVSVVLTPIPTIAANPTSSLTVTPTRTPFSTLTNLQPEQHHANIVRLLETNGGCELPCWWGITPGETTWEEAERLLSAAGVYPNEYTPTPDLVSSGWKWYGLPDSFFVARGVLQSSFEFDARKGIVEHITVIGNGSYDELTPDFRNMWAGLAPEKIIPILGIPSRIKVYSAFGPGEGVNTYAIHDLYIFYDSNGILIEYRVKNDLPSILKVCPTFDMGGNMVDSITIFFKPAGDTTPIENLDGAYQSASVLNLKDAVGMTTEEFYNLFMQTLKPICFNTLPSVFP